MTAVIIPDRTKIIFPTPPSHHFDHKKFPRSLQFGICKRGPSIFSLARTFVWVRPWRIIFKLRVIRPATDKNLPKKIITLCILQNQLSANSTSQTQFMLLVRLLPRAYAGGGFWGFKPPPLVRRLKCTIKKKLRF